MKTIRTTLLILSSLLLTSAAQAYGELDADPSEDDIGIRCKNNPNDPTCPQLPATEMGNDTSTHERKNDNPIQLKRSF